MPILWEDVCHSKPAEIPSLTARQSATMNYAQSESNLMARSLPAHRPRITAFGDRHKSVPYRIDQIPARISARGI